MTLPDVLLNAPGLRAAELVTDGLAVCCFKSAEFWEVAYPREAHHDLRLKIEELNEDDQPIKLVFDDEIDRNVISFDIKLTNGSVAHYTEFEKGGPASPDFDRSLGDANDPHDLGWMIDLRGDELRHGNFVRLLPRHPRRPLSLARIHHSLFCVLKPEDEDVRISPLDRDHPDADGSFVLGRNNTDIVGVLLATEPGEIRFEADPSELLNIEPLPHDETRRYRISIINEDRRPSILKERFVRGDLRIFYDRVIEVDGVKKDLWARPAREGERFFPDGDCHPPKFGGDSLQGLIEP